MTLLVANCQLPTMNCQLTYCCATHGGAGMYAALARRFTRARTELELQVLAATHMQSLARGGLTRHRAKVAVAAMIVQRRFRNNAIFRRSHAGRASKKRRRRTVTVPLAGNQQIHHSSRH